MIFRFVSYHSKILALRKLAQRASQTRSSGSNQYSGVVRLLNFPQLSPTMTQGRIIKWNGKIGDLIPANGLIMEIDAYSLTKTAEVNSPSRMEIEIQEDMYIAQLLVNEGALVDIGTPVAIFCEDSDDLPRLAGKDGGNLAAFQPAMWQAYVKSKTDPGSCGCS